jgi:catechol 2,3-dioxygenase-like lactoylglutathione lyase family enzyme
MSGARVIAIGHVGLRSSDPARLSRFYREVVGLRQVVKHDGFNAFEVGDVHFCITSGERRAAAGFDFATDDVPGLRAKLVASGVTCSEVGESRMGGHAYFGFTDPDGNEITVFNAHAAMPEVT